MQKGSLLVLIGLVLAGGRERLCSRSRGAAGTTVPDSDPPPPKNVKVDSNCSLLSRDSGALAGRKLRLSISTGGYSRTPARASTIFGRAWSDEPGTIGTANVSAYTLLDGNSATACAHIAVTRQHVTDQKQYYFWYQ